MSIYAGPVFEMARRQFNVIADHLDIPIDERDRLLYPKRAIAVSCPIHRDDGTIAVYQGYRVQHHLTLGPTKGGTRFVAQRRHRRGRGAGDLDELEMRAGRPALWRRQGRRHGRSARAVACASWRALSRRYMQEMIPFVGPHTDVMAPDMGTNEQVMAWFMDTYSMYQGRTVTEIVTGKPVASRRHGGPARGDRPRRRPILVERALERIGRRHRGRHRDRAGLRQCRQLSRRRRWRSAACG